MKLLFNKVLIINKKLWFFRAKIDFSAEYDICTDFVCVLSFWPPVFSLLSFTYVGQTDQILWIQYWRFYFCNLTNVILGMILHGHPHYT